MSSSKRQRNVKDHRSLFVYSSKSAFESSSSESSGEANSKQNLVTILLKDIKKNEKLRQDERKFDKPRVGKRQSKSTLYTYEDHYYKQEVEEQRLWKEEDERERRQKQRREEHWKEVRPLIELEKK
nr:hypothetical protein [Tanacetum cinerariifolium]